jgi:pimeloyl-ACP methyl ester carboxylesterase
MAYAARHPERVSRLILLGAYTSGAGGGRSRTTAGRVDLDLARPGWGLQEPALRQVFASQIQPAGSLEDWIAFDHLQCRTTTPENAVRFREQFAAIDVLDQARTIQCPTWCWIPGTTSACPPSARSIESRHQGLPPRPAGEPQPPPLMSRPGRYSLMRSTAFLDS